MNDLSQTSFPVTLLLSRKKPPNYQRLTVGAKIVAIALVTIFSIGRTTTFDSSSAATRGLKDLQMCTELFNKVTVSTVSKVLEQMFACPT